MTIDNSGRPQYKYGGLIGYRKYIFALLSFFISAIVLIVFHFIGIPEKLGLGYLEYATWVTVGLVTASEGKKMVRDAVANYSIHKHQTLYSQPQTTKNVEYDENIEGGE